MHIGLTICKHSLVYYGVTYIGAQLLFVICLALGIVTEHSISVTVGCHGFIAGVISSGTYLQDNCKGHIFKYLEKGAVQLLSAPLRKLGHCSVLRHLISLHATAMAARSSVKGQTLSTMLL